MEGTLGFVYSCYRSFRVWCFGEGFFVVAITLAIRPGMINNCINFFYRPVHNLLSCYMDLAMNCFSFDLCFG